MSHSFGKQVQEAFNSELHKAYAQVSRKISLHELSVQRLVSEFVNLEVLPNLQSQLESLDASDPNMAEEFAYVAEFIEKVKDYAPHIRVKSQGIDVTFEIELEHKETYYNLEYGSPYTDTFPHMDRIAEFLQNLSYEVNKIEGITGFPLQLGRSSL